MDTCGGFPSENLSLRRRSIMNEEEKLRLTEIKVMPTKRDCQNVASRMTSSSVVTRYRIGDDHVSHDEKKCTKQ